MDKETLQKKIESGDTVWGVDYINTVLRLDLRNYEPKIMPDDRMFRLLDKDGVEQFYPLKWIFATKEEAEWQLEFGNITRTEKLELPTWEQFRRHQEKSFRTPVDDMVDLINLKGKDRRTIIVSSRMIYKRYKTYDRETYLEACRLCKKLFLGEEL